MTRDEILNIPAGREMDEAIESFVFGWKPKTKDDYYREDFKPYSTDISAAWEMEEHLYNFGQVMNVVMQRKYIIALSNVLEFDFGYEGKVQMIHATPHQRSRAALLAVTQ